MVDNVAALSGTKIYVDSFGTTASVCYLALSNLCHLVCAEWRKDEAGTEYTVYVINAYLGPRNWWVNTKLHAAR
jgi:hypothetical protein